MGCLGRGVWLSWGDDFLIRAAGGDSLVEVMNVLADLVDKPRASSS